MPDESLTIRRATPDDAAIIAEHRARMFQDLGRLDAPRAAAMMEQVQPMLGPILASGEYVGWLAVAASGAVVAGAGVQVRRLLPRPETSVDREALVVNVYVQSAYRRLGLARRLMAAVLDWCREQGIERVALHASSMGHPLYESLGFTPTNEMVRLLEGARNQ
ncbi:MAG TPA: GNAT family N-acetyltransferase [Ktedonobacterales bacterium]|nr:GNAT family N-acetyltransferase [Ktedonobacterales bacterium]